MFVLPDEEGPGAILETRSSKSLLVGSTLLPAPSLPQMRALRFVLAGSSMRTGDVDLAGIRPGHGAPSARFTSEWDRRLAGRASWRRPAGWLVVRVRTG